MCNALKAKELNILKKQINFFKKIAIVTSNFSKMISYGWDPELPITNNINKIYYQLFKILPKIVVRTYC